jgi:hypothetical protein
MKAFYIDLLGKLKYIKGVHIYPRLMLHAHTHTTDTHTQILSKYLTYFTSLEIIIIMMLKVIIIIMKIIITMTNMIMLAIIIIMIMINTTMLIQENLYGCGFG